MSTGKKRKLDSNVVGEAAKKVKIVSPDGTSRAVPATQASGPADNTQPSQSSGHKDQSKPETLKSKHTIKKLVPPRPFPTVPTSVSATGPRSAHKEGKNYICLTRKTPLGAYMRRCKDVILKDGFKTLHLSAMGAAIPHLLQLALALPAILPFSKDEIHTDIQTNTVEVQDEVIPNDEDEDISYRTRGKSTLLVVLMIGDGDRDGGQRVSQKKNGGPSGSGKSSRPNKGKPPRKTAKPAVSSPQVLHEPEQEDTEMI